MVVFVPVAFRMPAMLVLVPPAMLFAPATLAGFVQLVSLVIGLRAVASMALDRTMQFMLLMCNASLATVHFVAVEAWNYSEQQKSSRKKGYGCGRHRL